MTRDYNQPAAGATDWHTPLNENFADLAIEVADQVPTWSDLPTPSGETSSNGNPRVYRVEADDVFVRDAGDSWAIIGGLGSSSHPLPQVTVDDLTTNNQPTLAGCLNAFSDVTLLASGSATDVASGGTSSQILTGYTLDDPGNMMDGLVRPDVSDSSADGADYDWVIGASAGQPTDVSLQVRASSDGNYDAWVRNESATQLDIHYALWEVAP